MKKNEGITTCSICGFYPVSKIYKKVDYCEIHYRRAVDLDNTIRHNDKCDRVLNSIRVAISASPTIPEVTD